MRSVVTFEIDPEYIKWPPVCACCGGPDERDFEMAVCSTSEEEPDLIMECRIPFCLECHDHAALRTPWWSAIALLVVLAFAAASTPYIWPRLFGGAVVVGIAMLAFYVGFLIRTARRFMKPSCAGMNDLVTFGHPTSSTVATVILKSERFADKLRELNRYCVVES